MTFVDYNEGGADSTYYYYDKLGNRTSVVDGGTTSYLSNSLNQYTSVGGTGYSYDDNGNLTDDGTYDYYYDCENRLTDVNEGASKVASYEYDYRGRRISKTDYTLNPARCTLYCYDEDQVIAEYEGDTLVRKFIYGPGIDEPICMITVSGQNETVYYYHFDGLGSVAALSNSSGNIVEEYSYKVYGEPNRTSSIGNPYFFTGREYDTETGLYYYRARYYKPEIGRFLQTDPIGYYDSLNLYTYVGNNPLNWSDPWGLCKDGIDRRFTWEETKAEMNRALRTFSYTSFIAYAPELGSYGFDYLGGQEFTIPRDFLDTIGVKANSHWGFSNGNYILRGTEFGNFIAGFRMTWNWSLPGHWVTSFLGHLTSIAENGTFDDPESRADISAGADVAGRVLRTRYYYYYGVLVIENYSLLEEQ